MNSRKIPKYFKENTKDNKEMYKLLNDLYLFQLEERGWWKESYKEIINKYIKED